MECKIEQCPAHQLASKNKEDISELKNFIKVLDDRTHTQTNDAIRTQERLEQVYEIVKKIEIRMETESKKPEMRWNLVINTLITTLVTTGVGIFIGFLISK